MLHRYDDFVNGRMMMLAAGLVVLTGLFMTPEIYYQWNGFCQIKINDINTCSQCAHKHINNGLKCTAECSFQLMNFYLSLSFTLAAVVL